ncbi:MAG: YdcF family protein [Nitrospirae bacterium]|uniref:YdcF family protein n=1 Tax=Candidatus Magnetobacterium casense TaxID=1455061 RepID=UPI00058CA3E4|nr:YdcF family protein [Candidatus Magnetobacterium casensis]MBF0338065.1 YdcF family protein [Nitrospirota bacterium]
MLIDRRSKHKGRLVKRTAIVLVVLLIALYTFHVPILNYLASQLVYKDNVRPCDAIVVLTGDYTGERLMAAIDLLKKGYGKYIVFWGGPIYWKITIAELYLRQLKDSGVEPEYAVWSDERLPQLSTTAEAKVNMRLLKDRGARSFILVTSHYHTARARNVYNPLAANNGITMVVYPATDSNVKLQQWWKERESAKVIFIEFQKTIWYKLFQ